jgi:hypothetical protein
VTDAATDLIVLHGRGHPNVRASHSKTIELTPDTGLGAGGTCIVAVGATVRGDPIAGVVRCELSTAREMFTFDALANPGWDPTGPAVIRRSELRRRDTLATHAAAAAADLPAQLRAALTDPSAQVRLSVRRRPEEVLRVVLVSGPIPAVEYEAADQVIEQVIEQGGSGGWVAAPSRGRVLLHGARVPRQLVTAGTPIEVLGLAPQAAVAAVSPPHAPMVVAEVKSLIEAGLRTSTLVLRLHASELDKTLRTAMRHGRRTGAILGALPWLRWGELTDLVAPPGARTVWLCLDPAPAEATDAQLLARIVELRGAGVATKAVARTVSGEFGVPTKRVYDLAIRSGGGQP